MNTEDDASLPTLWASEARFRNVIEANADGVIVLFCNGVIALANPAACRLLGRSVENLVGQVFGIPVMPGETTEIDVPRFGGELRVAELRVAETTWEGSPALLASLRDITEHKRLEEKLRKQAEQLAEADRRKDEFLAMLAHELRNPLAPILNAAYVMRLSHEDPLVLSKMRQVIEEQVRHLAHLVDDLLDVSRFTQGKIQLRKESIDVAAVVAQAVEAARPAIEARNHSFSVSVSDEPMRLEADPTRLRQILSNLLDNAAKYTDFGGAIHLSAKREGDDVVFMVRDNGIGISGEMLPRVFDLFAQADNSLDRSRGGLGIGLTLVKSLIVMHGGTIQAQSDGLDQGCDIVVRLPLSTQPEPARADATSVNGMNASKRVLVVDDNRASADGVGLILQLSGHISRVVYDGPEALEVAGLFQPDFVLLDIGLPGMDGFEVATHMRQRTDLDGVVLVAATGYGHREVVERLQAVGFDHHMLKPLDFDALLAMLNAPKHRE